MTRDLIVIGASAGGVEALRLIARGLPANLPAAVLVVKHMNPHGPHLLPRILESAGPLAIGEVIEGAPIELGKIYIAPPDHHLLVQENRVRLTKGPKENHCRPAVDPLFRTAAMSYGARVIGVILTGRLDDGTAGLAVVKERGGLSIVQDPRDALYPSMPTSALRHVGADYTVPLADIPQLLARVAGQPTGTDAPPPVSRLREVESRFDTTEKLTMQNLDAIGSRAGLTCPDCHGPMWKVKDPAVDRFRCLVGHGHTAASILEAQEESQESYLSQALRLMNERASLLFEMRARAEDTERAVEALPYAAELAQLEKDISVIREMLERNGASSPFDSG